MPTCLLGDKGYDSNTIRSQLATIGCAVVIPSTATRYEKTVRNYSAVVTLGCVMLWLRL